MIDRRLSAGARDVVVAHASDVHVDDSYTARLFGGDGAGGPNAQGAGSRAGSGFRLQIGAR